MIDYKRFYLAGRDIITSNGPKINNANAANAKKCNLVDFGGAISPSWMYSQISNFVWILSVIGLKLHTHCAILDDIQN